MLSLNQYLNGLMMIKHILTFILALNVILFASGRNQYRRIYLPDSALGYRQNNSFK